MKAPDSPALDALLPDAAPTPGTEAARRAAALLWLAGSSPLTEAPAGSLDAVRLRLGLSHVSRRRYTARWLAAAGWAAAAALALVVWQQQHGPLIRQGGEEPVPPEHAPTAVSTHSPPAGTGTLTALEDKASLRAELAGLRASFSDTTHDKPGIHRPVILELTPPGAAPAAGSRERVMELIATALENDLQRGTGSGAAGELVIESGWADWSTASLPPGTTIRHRTFPSARAAELNLLAGPGGQFLDPATGWLWSPDAGSTDFTGQPAPAGLDRAAFAAPPRAPGSSQLAATGYAITGSSGQTIVALNNLPAVADGGSLRLAGFASNGQAVTLDVPLNASSLSDGWNFSGIITAYSLAADRGFTVNSTTATGQTGLILQAGAVR